MKLILAFAALAVSTVATAQGFPPVVAKRIAAPAQPDAIPLYAGKAPGSERAAQQEVWSEVFGQTWARNVTRPTLTPVLPKPGTGNGTAVLVVPGGGFQFLSMSNEGWPIAQWLADRGIAAFVLKYRVEPTPDAEPAFAQSMMDRMKAGASGKFDPMLGSAAIASADAQVALRLIRANAAKWGIDTRRVGMLGFSAGAMTTMTTVLADTPDARPDFIAPIYGRMTPITPPAKPQPMFVALAADDPLFGNQGFGLIESWKQAGGSVELHLYSGGSHGFGSNKLGTTSDLWFDQFMAWMKAQGLLAAARK